MYHPAGSQSVAALHGLAASRGQNCLAGDRRAIAFQRSSRSLVRKWSFHAARLNFPRGEPLEPSFCIALRALSLSAARLCGPLPNRVLSWSSFITPSSRQCRRFSMAQCWRTTSLNRSGAKAVLSRQCAVSVLVLSAVSRTRCTLPMAASPGPWCSFLQPANLGGDGRRAGFNPPVIALHSRSGGHRLALRIVEQTPDIVMQRTLVGLQRQRKVTLVRRFVRQWRVGSWARRRSRWCLSASAWPATSARRRSRST
jgi:hypothetical protein